MGLPVLLGAAEVSSVPEGGDLSAWGDLSASLGERSRSLAFARMSSPLEGDEPSSSRRKLLLLLLSPQAPLALPGAPVLPGACACAWLVPLLCPPWEREPEYDDWLPWSLAADGEVAPFTGRL